MKIGFIGAGKAGCSLGKYFCEKTLPDLTLTGFYSKTPAHAQWAAQFTQSQFFSSIEDVISYSDVIIISTPDSVVDLIWQSIPKETLKGKIICHLSGSLSSDVFSKKESYGAYGISIHPLFAFSNKESVYQQLHQACFTLEGDSYAVELWQKFFADMGNPTLLLRKEDKTAYHAAASMLSNHVLAVLDCGYQLLQSCGFTDAQARQFTANLVTENLQHAISSGTIQALTGPIERGDLETVEKHLSCLDSQTKPIYQSCVKRLISLAEQKNPDRDYAPLKQLLTE